MGVKDQLRHPKRGTPKGGGDGVHVPGGHRQLLPVVGSAGNSKRGRGGNSGCGAGAPGASRAQSQRHRNRKVRRGVLRGRQQSPPTLSGVRVPAQVSPRSRPGIMQQFAVTRGSAGVLAGSAEQLVPGSPHEHPPRSSGTASTRRAPAVVPGGARAPVWLSPAALTRWHPPSPPDLSCLLGCG